MATKTNLRRMKPSGKSPAPGDVFAMLMPTGNHLFGRVVLAEPPREKAPMPGAYLIYIYAWQSPTSRPDYSQLRRDRLLIPPLWTNKLAWTKGYFQTVENRPLEDAVILTQHCFRSSTGKLVDETGRPLDRRSEPCGEWGSASYRWIDDHVSDAVGIRRAPED